MNNKPVAWKVIETDDDGNFTTFTEIEPVWDYNAIPLYTGFKELTDEKILQLQAEYGIDSDLTCHSVKDFVLAILLEAQEK